MSELDDRLRAEIRRDRFRAHEALFPHRHEYPFAPFHRQLIEDFWSADANFVDLGFRECGKTTLVEEALTIAACEGAFRNCIIVGAKEALAAELLSNVKVELEQNDALISVYGEMRGDTWQQTRFTTRLGYCMQAIGRDQSLRGTKHRDWRPDLVVINDFEDDDELLTPEGRRKTLRWLLRVLLPACDRYRRKIRIYDTVRDADSVPMTLIKRRGWPHRLIPITYLDEEGVERPAWPGHPSLTMEWIAAEKATYQSLGELEIWDREYMMDASETVNRDFRPEFFRVEPRVLTWEPVWCMIDPARTRNATSSMTGAVAFSWIGNELVVWEDRTAALRPSEIVDLMFEWEERYRPVAIGFEENGLEEWASEPIRAEQHKRGIFLSVQPLRAPRDKLSFIRGLEPHARSGEMVFCRDFPVLREQFLSFPRGRIDGPNALAYAKVMRPGLPVYENFMAAVHVADHIMLSSGEPMWLALNATGAYVTAVLFTASYGRIAIIKDWVREGDPGAVIPDVLAEARLYARRPVDVVAPPQHFEEWNNVGLVQAVRHLPMAIGQGTKTAKGMEQIRRDLARMVRDVPAFRVDSAARWTLCALAAGYARKPGKPEPEASFYRTLMEGLESAVGLMSLGVPDENVDWAYTANGRRYRRYGSAFERRLQ